MSALANKLAQIAKTALFEELITYPKPGLVSHIDNGSHGDMNYAIFIASITSLENYFQQMAVSGGTQQDFILLETLGMQAEVQMLNATNNINTHRGIIFILGILIAATAYCLEFNLAHTQISQTISSLYTMGLLQHKLNHDSHGSQVRQTYQLEGIIDSAIAGFPLLFNAVEQFKLFLQNYSYTESKLLTFFYIMQYLDDSNLVYRGGIEALYFAKAQAKFILQDPKQLYAQALKLHHEFIRQNLSPGGSADLLSAVLFLTEAEKIWD